MGAQPGDLQPKTRKLLEELHGLRACASNPSYRRIADGVSEAGGDFRVGHATVQRLFTTFALPRARLLLSVVDYLAKESYRRDADLECDRFDSMFRDALSEWMPNLGSQTPPSADSDPADGDDEDGTSGCGAFPGPPAPQRPGGGAAPRPKPTAIEFRYGDLSTSRTGGDNPGDPKASRALIVWVGRPETGKSARLYRDLADTLGPSCADGVDLLNNPTHAQLWSALATAINGTEGTLLLYYGGPSFRDQRTGDFALATADTNIGADGLVDNTVSLADLRVMLAHAPAARIVLIADYHTVGTAERPYTVIPSGKPVDAVFLDNLTGFAATPRPAVVVGQSSGGTLLAEALLAGLQQAAALAEPFSIGQLSTAAGSRRPGDLCCNAVAGGESIMLPAAPAGLVPAAAPPLPSAKDKEAGPAAAHQDDDHVIAPLGQGKSVISVLLAMVGAMAVVRGSVVRLWELGTGRLLHELGGAAAVVTGLTVSADGDRLVIGYEDGMVVVWDPVSGARRRLASQTGPVTAMVSGGGRGGRGGGWLASASGSVVRLWELGTGRLLHELGGAAAVVTGLTVSADGDRLAVTYADGTIKVGTPTVRDYATVARTGRPTAQCQWLPAGDAIAVSIGGSRPHIIDV